MGKLATGFQGESFQATFLEMLISLSFLFSSFIGVHYGTSILLQASRLNGKHERNLTDESDQDYSSRQPGRLYGGLSERLRKRKIMPTPSHQ